MASKIENWDELKGLYVINGKSHRQIAEIAGCSNSTVSSRANREDWEGQRQAYKASLAVRGYENAAEAVANQNKAVLQESVIVARAYIRKFAESIRDGSVRTNAKDALEMMKFLAEALPKEADAGKVIDGTAVRIEGTGEGTDLLRRLVEVARARVAPPGGLGGDPVERPSGTRPN